MRIANILASIVLICIGLAAVVWIIPTQTVEVDPGELPGSLLPNVAAWLLIGASVWQLCSETIGRRLAWSATSGDSGGAEPGQPGDGQSAHQTQTAGEPHPNQGVPGGAVLFFLASAALLSLMLLLIARFGYMIGGAAGLLALGLLLRPQGSARWWLIALAAVLPPTIYFLAWQLLRLSLP